MTGYCVPFLCRVIRRRCRPTWRGRLISIGCSAASAKPSACLSRRHARPCRRLRALDAAIGAARPGAALYHPFISSAGERGPFNDPDARAALLGLDQDVTLADLARGIYEGIAFAARDCYAAMGNVPRGIRLTGGAARSAAMHRILASVLDRPVRSAAQQEAGAAGAAMIAAVCIGLFPDMAAVPRNGRVRRTARRRRLMPALARAYDALFPIYRDTYLAMPGLWRRLHAAREGIDAGSR